MRTKPTTTASAMPENERTISAEKPTAPTHVDMVHLRQERDVALQQAKDCETISRRAFKQRDDAKAHADALAEALRDILNAADNGLPYTKAELQGEAFKDARKALAAYGEGK